MKYRGKEERMSYREEQRQKAAKIRDEVIKDPGQGLFYRKPRDFVLSEPASNLWEGIRADAVEYFNKNQIKWWKGEGDKPTGHLLSSQVACVNHLYFVRQRHDAATKILKAIEPSIVSAETVDTGFVEFEFIGGKQYLKEKAFTRGANCTSVDAAMIGKNGKGEKVLFLIEWKYTEYYQSESLYIPERSKVYDGLINATDSPFVKSEPQAFYYEPFYQMMRQTLLGSLCAKNKDHDCVDFRHVHVIPAENKELLNTITSPKFSGKTLSEAWGKVLKEPQKYKTVSPEEFIRPAGECLDTNAVLEYLKVRYWN